LHIAARLGARSAEIDAQKNTWPNQLPDIPHAQRMRINESTDYGEYVALPSLAAVPFPIGGRVIARFEFLSRFLSGRRKGCRQGD